MRESRSFQAQFPGRCNLCGDEYKSGDWLHYVGRTVAHDYCHGEPIYREHEEERDRSQPFIVKGRRNHEKRCSTCFLTHAGDCP